CGAAGSRRSRGSGGCAPSTCSIETPLPSRYFPPAMIVIPQKVRDGFGNLLDPLALRLIRLHVRPNLITTLGTAVIVGSAVAFALGWTRWGGVLLLLSGLCDMVDGRVARRGGMVTTFGAFYDSTLDRVGEAALFSGTAIYFLRGGVPPGRVTLAVVACIVALTASLLVSYTRARAEGLGLSVKVGIAQRAERVLLLGAADRLAFADGDDPAGEAHREAQSQNQGIRAARRFERPGVRGLGPDSGRRVRGRGEGGRAGAARASGADQGFPPGDQAAARRLRPELREAAQRDAREERQEQAGPGRTAAPRHPRLQAALGGRPAGDDL